MASVGVGEHERVMRVGLTGIVLAFSGRALLRPWYRQLPAGIAPYANDEAVPAVDRVMDVTMGALRDTGDVCCPGLHSGHRVLGGRRADDLCARVFG